MTQHPLAAFMAGLRGDRDQEDWQDLALCAETDPEAYFPEKGGSTAAAKATCDRCDVREQCLDYALTEDIHFGVWGGTSERERRKLRAERRAPKLPVTEASVTLLRDPARIAAVLAGDTNQAA